VIVGFLTFRLSREDYLALDRRHLGVALLCTWVVGIGRWWDDEKASLLLRSGLGSVAYTCILAGLFWLVVLPLRPRDWTYPKVLTLVAMTAPPGIVHAIPIERIFDLTTANVVNLCSLAAVATWRAALVVHFLVRSAAIGWASALVCSLLPITAIVTALSALNLHRVVFNITGSYSRTVHDETYGVLVLLMVLLWYSFPLTAIGYLVAAVVSGRKPRRD
jgi:hypothetical protein